MIGKNKLIIFAAWRNEISPVEIDQSTGKLINQDLHAQWSRTAKTCEILADFIKENQKLSLYCHTWQWASNWKYIIKI